jgi:hypothetical protein
LAAKEDWAINVEQRRAGKVAEITGGDLRTEVFGIELRRFTFE